MGIYLQYGCGLSAPEQWLNFDASPNLWLSKLPVVGKILRPFLGTHFPNNVRFGNIVKGIHEIKRNSADGIYCSHVLEHLSYNDCKIALQNTYRMLKPGGIFRLVLPDLEYATKTYLRLLQEDAVKANYSFMENITTLGLIDRPKGLVSNIKFHFGNYRHLWMWDYPSLKRELELVGFVEVRKCHFNDASDTMFNHVEDKHRFDNALAIECRKK